MTKPEATDTFETTPLGQALAEYDGLRKEVKVLVEERQAILGEGQPGPMDLVASFAKARTAQMKHFARTE